MATVQIQLLGGFRMTSNDAGLPTLTRPRQQAFLAYLLLECRHPQARQTIAATFWPESSDAQANKNLRVLLVEVRSVWPQVDHYVQIERTTLQWLPNSTVTVDLFAFEEALQTAAVHYPQTPEQAVAALRTATALYTGDLLPHLYDQWLQPLHQRLAEQYKTALGQLAALQQERGCFADAIQAAQRLQHYDPLSEQACRLLLACYPLQGEKARALQAYQQYEEALLRELGVEPEADLKAIYLELLSQQMSPHQTSRFTPLPQTEPTPTLVGRAQEWSRLTALWRTALPQTPAFVLLTGEAGIGKTQLAEQFLRWAKGQGAVVAAAKCYAFGSADGEEALSYAPVVTWLRGETLSAHLPRLSKQWLNELLRLLPELQQAEPDLPNPEPIRHGLQRKHFFEAVAHAIGAAGRPVLLFVDDLQWCDRETLDWLLYLLLQFPLTTPLLIVGALRSGEVADQHPYHPWRAQLRYHQRWQEVLLPRLTPAETTQVAQELLMQAAIPQPLSTAFGDLLHRHTEGNPLFIVETMRTLVTDVSPDRTDWSQTLTTALAGGSLPVKVQAVIEQRLSTLSPRAHQLVELSAVIGRAFAADILHTLHRDENELVAALEELLHRQLIREQTGDQYDFTHDRVREAVYAGVSQTRRRLLHKQVAGALETVYQAKLDAVYGQIALHYDHAGQIAQAVDFYERASKVAQRLYANQETAAYLRRGLTLLGQLPATRERDQKELALLLPLGVILNIGRRFGDPELNFVFEKIYALSRQIEDAEQRFDALRGLCEHHRSNLRMQASLEVAEYLVDFATETMRADLMILAYTEKGVSLAQICRSTEAMYCFEQAITHYQPEQHATLTTRLAFHPLIAAMCQLATTKQLLGYADQAMALVNRAGVVANEIAHPASIFYVHLHVGMVYLYRSEIAMSYEVFTKLNIFAEKISGHRYTLVEMTCIALAIRLSSEKQILVEEITRLRQHLFRDEELIVELGTVIFLLTLSLGYIKCNQIDRAEEMLAMAIETLKVTGPAQAGDVLRYYLAGKLSYLRGDFAQAEAWLQEGIPVLQSYQHKPYELRLVIELAKLWSATGRNDEAKTLVTELYHWFTEGFDTPVMQDARYLLAYLDGQAEFIEDLTPFVHW